MKRLLLDMDGVISDFVAGIIRHHRCGECLWKNPGDFKIVRNTNVKEEGFWDNVHAEYWENLPLTHDAKQIVAMVEAVFSEICVLTHFPISHGYPIERAGAVVDGKMRWLRKHFPQLLKHFLIGNEKDFVAGPDLWLLDDYDHNVNAFKARGGNAILLPRIWNSKHNLLTLPELAARLRELSH